MKKIKNLFTAALIVLFAPSVYSQSTNNSSGVSISAYVPEDISNVPVEAREYLKNKLNQLITQNGITNGAIGSRFIITPSISTLSKDILPGPPPMHAMNLQITFYIGDGIAGKKFSSKSMEVKAIGTNETKAFIEGIKNVNPNDAGLVAFLNDGKQKIIDYYNNNCESIIKSAQSAASGGNYEEAIAQLTGIPDACKPCYDKGLAAAEPMYKKYIDQQCGVKLTQARAAWNSNQNSTGAASAGELLASIDASANCYGEAVNLNKEISNRMTQLGDKNWEYKMKVQEGNVEVAKARINAYRDIGVAYYTRRSIIVYNIRGWW